MSANDKIIPLHKTPIKSPMIFIISLLIPSYISLITYDKIFCRNKDNKYKIPVFLNTQNKKNINIDSFSDDYQCVETVKSIKPNTFIRVFTIIVLPFYNAYLQRRLLFYEVESMEKSILISLFLYPFSFAQTIKYMQDEKMYMYRDLDEDINNFYHKFAIKSTV